jgi:hypothetical protein
MSTLNSHHPVQLTIGELLIQEELARKHGQLTFGVIARDCIEWACEVRDVLREIASDAAYGELLVERVAADGKVTRNETHDLKNLFKEIELEAREGRVIA